MADRTVTPQIRTFFWGLGSAFSGIAGLVLFLFPEKTDTLFAWTIARGDTANFLGRLLPGDQPAVVPLLQRALVAGGAGLLRRHPHLRDGHGPGHAPAPRPVQLRQRRARRPGLGLAVDARLRGRADRQRRAPVPPAPGDRSTPRSGRHAHRPRAAASCSWPRGRCCRWWAVVLFVSPGSADSPVAVAADPADGPGRGQLPARLRRHPGGHRPPERGRDPGAAVRRLLVAGGAGGHGHHPLRGRRRHRHRARPALRPGRVQPPPGRRGRRAGRPPPAGARPARPRPAPPPQTPPAAG